MISGIRKGMTDMTKSNSAAIPGRNIRTFRQRNGLSIKTMAGFCGISERHLCDIENSKSNVKSDTIDKICAALGCRVSDAFDPEFDPEL